MGVFFLMVRKTTILSFCDLIRFRRGGGNAYFFSGEAADFFWWVAGGKKNGSRFHQMQRPDYLRRWPWRCIIVLKRFKTAVLKTTGSA